MPIFEYKCEACGHTMEVLEKTAGVHKHVCERCKSPNLQKLFSAFSVGQSKSAPLGCDSCPSGPYPNETCASGICPHGPSH